MPASNSGILIIRTDVSCVPAIRSFLQKRLDRTCAYRGSFLVYEHELERLLAS
jgi:hypothetical protein